MPADGKKGITVKIDAKLHAEVRQYLESHEMTMAEFVTLALDYKSRRYTNTAKSKRLDALAKNTVYQLC